MDNEYFPDAGIPPLLHFDQPPTPTWHSLPPPANPDRFSDSAPTSIVSSPGPASNDGFLIRVLIGKLGSIWNSGEISPPPNAPAPYVFAHPGNLPSMPGDSGFAERAARFSSFRSRSFNRRTSQFGHPHGSGFPSDSSTQSNSGRKLQRVLSSPSLKVENENDMNVNGYSGNCGVEQGESGNSSSVSEQTQPGVETGSRPGSASSRKRKSAPSLPRLEQSDSPLPLHRGPKPEMTRLQSESSRAKIKRLIITLQMRSLQRTTFMSEQGEAKQLIVTVLLKE